MAGSKAPHFPHARNAHRAAMSGRLPADAAGAPLVKRSDPQGRRYTCTDPEGDAARWFVCHRDVEDARARLAQGGQPAGVVSAPPAP